MNDPERSSKDPDADPDADQRDQDEPVEGVVGDFGDAEQSDRGGDSDPDAG